MIADHKSAPEENEIMRAAISSLEEVSRRMYARLREENRAVDVAAKTLGVSKKPTKAQFAHNPNLKIEKERQKRRRAYGKMIVELLSPLERNIHTELQATMYTLRTMVNADRMSVYFVDKDELFFSIAEEDLMVRIPKTSGIAGAVATSGKRLIIKDVYDDVRFNKSIDEKTGYRTKSVLCVPIKNLAGDVVAVLQLINKLKQKKKIDLTGLSTREQKKLLQPTQLGHLNWNQQTKGEEAKIISFTEADAKPLNPFATSSLALSKLQERSKSVTTQTARTMSIASRKLLAAKKPLKNCQLLALQW